MLGQCGLTRANTFASRGDEKALPLWFCSAVFPDWSELYPFLHVRNSRKQDGFGRTRLHQGQWGQHDSPEQLTPAAWSDLVSWTCSASLHCPNPSPKPAKPSWAEEGEPPFTLCVESLAGDQWWFEPALTLPSRLQRNWEKRHALTDIPGIQNS